MPADGQTNRLLGYPPDARLLIINADDFGMCHAVNQAIVGSAAGRHRPLHYLDGPLSLAVSCHALPRRSSCKLPSAFTSPLSLIGPITVGDR